MGYKDQRLGVKGVSEFMDQELKGLVGLWIKGYMNYGLGVKVYNIQG